MHTPIRQQHVSVGDEDESMPAASFDVEEIRARARHLQDGDNFNATVEAWNELLEKNPDDVDAANELGNILARLGRFEEAFRLFRRALRIRPGLASAQANAGI